jgi:hypothetical protein
MMEKVAQEVSGQGAAASVPDQQLQSSSSSHRSDSLDASTMQSSARLHGSSDTWRNGSHQDWQHVILAHANNLLQVHHFLLGELCAAD